MLFAIFNLLACLTSFGQSWVVTDIQFDGNKKTREYILLRELTFSVGDTLSETDWENFHKERSTANLQNTGLFNEINIDWNQPGTVLISLVERWYVWPQFTLENADRNFNNWWIDKDFSRLSIGAFVDWKNVRGRNETAVFKGQVGFERELGFSYTFPYLTKDAKTGLTVAYKYSTNREVNYASENHNRLFYKSPIGFDGKKETYAKLGVIRRSDLFNTHTLNTYFHQIEVADSITFYSSDYLKNNQSRTSFFRIGYFFKRERRDNRAYPTKGYTVQFQAIKSGLGILKNEGLNLLESQLTIDSHWRLAEKWTYSSGLKGKLNMLDSPPYYHQRGLGYSRIVRGYELYVFDGQDYVLIQNNLKFRILNRKDFNINLLKHQGFNRFFFASYLNLIADFGYVSDQLYGDVNRLSNTWIGGYGLGWDLISSYDFVMRWELTRNFENESGLYLHFKKSI